MTRNKYIRTIKGVEIDIYDILAAWGVTCPATQHAIKKLMMPGQRGGKGKAQDLAEARDAVLRAIELEQARRATDLVEKGPLSDSSATHMVYCFDASGRAYLKEEAVWLNGE